MSTAALPDHPAVPLAVEMRGIDKSFGAIVANAGASLRVRVGEIHALVGENGAGKSTLMTILAGLVDPDDGEIFVRNQRVTEHSTAAAMRLGIGMVHQHFMLIPALTVAENVILGRELTRGGMLDLQGAASAVRALSESYGLAVDPLRRIADLSVGEQQRVEILKVLYRGSDILLLDEPTAVLTPREVRELFAVIGKLTAAGKSAVVVTHKLDEVVEHSEHVTVMRRGRTVAEMPTRSTTSVQLARAMVARDVLLTVARPAEPAARTDRRAVLEVRGLEVDREVGVRAGVRAIAGLDFTLHAGEILGIAGVEGNGQRELIEALTGLRSLAAGSVKLNGKDLESEDVESRLRLGVAHIPEDRQRRGLVLDYPMESNLILGRLGEFARGWLDFAAIRGNAVELAVDFDIRPPLAELPARSFSGGNQQKIVIARELTRPAHALLIAAQPTRGVDIGAIEAIHRLLLDERRRGVAVLLISSELSEILSLSDRILVLYRGRGVATLEAMATNGEELGEMMTGARGTSAAGAAGT